MISTRGRYALRVMTALAADESDRYVPLDEIAEKQGISKKYLEIIIKTLVEHRLLSGRRGKGGGYRLTRKPEEYTVGEILELTEGTLAIVACLRSDAEPCSHSDECVTLPMWRRFDGMVHDFSYGVTLKSLMEDEAP